MITEGESVLTWDENINRFQIHPEAASMRDIMRMAIELSERRYPTPVIPSEVLELVNRQAEDPGLWFQARTAPEAYLQRELRALHAAIEGITPEESARRFLDQGGDVE